MKLQQTNNDYIVSYMAMRQLIGVIGIALPFALIIGTVSNAS
jgi:hypothetical protein